MTVIDLGELRDGPEPETLPRRPRSAGRPLRVTLVAALLAATMAGAAPTAKRVSAAVPASAGAEAFLTGDRLFVVQQPMGESGGTAEVLAYPLPERAATVDRPPTPVWRARVPVTGRLWHIEAGAGVVLLSVGANDGSAHETVALDRRTGRERWRQAGFPSLHPSGTLLLQPAGGPGTGTVRSVDPASGRALWSLPVPPEGVRYSGRDGMHEWLVLVPSAGSIEVRDARSGALLHSAELPTGEGPAGSQPVVTEDLLLLIRPQAGIVTAYRLAGMRRLWETRLPQVAYVDPCGELLCAVGQTGGIRALDPATGAIRWSGEQWSGTLSTHGDRLLAITMETGVERFGVLDVATGRQIADFGSWQLMPWPDGTRFFAVRPAGGGCGLLVGELDVAAARVRLLDVLPDASGDCRGNGDTLLCRLRGGGFGLWRLRN